MNGFNWKIGLIFAFAFAIACMAIYLFAGATVDYACTYTNSSSFGCAAYTTIGIGITAYADLILRFIAPECVGGGPDSCIGPALMIMLGTLLVVGFTFGGVLFRRKLSSHNHPEHVSGSR